MSSALGPAGLLKSHIAQLRLAAAGGKNMKPIHKKTPALTYITMDSYEF
jgi:hypothetical protein